MVMERGKRGETYNIGGNNRWKYPHCRAICDYLDKNERPKNHKSRRELITFVKDRPGHDRRYAIDSTKIQRELGWHPSESFETGLNKTIRWYLDNRVWIDHVKSGDTSHG
jgi:dTDP-glucose 4,6-dehydratase